VFYNRVVSETILATKLYIPQHRANVVLRPHLTKRLDEDLYRKLTLISAPAGFGKTTLLSEWVASCQRPAAWLSLDEGDNDPTRFLTYFISALQKLTLSRRAELVEAEVDGIVSSIGEKILNALQSPQPPPIEPILTALLNEISTIPDDFILILDDYHNIDAKTINDILAFLLEHLPPRMHLVIITREDPNLPLARLRVHDQLTELRVTDLRFTLTEAAGFLKEVMGLSLSAEDITALEARTEGWIAGLQLAALALKGTTSVHGHQDATSFIRTFTGSHHFVMDYLVEEVLQQQSESVQTFLLCTSILDRMCGPLCDAVLLNTSASGQETLEHLERANLFIVPLDNERRWYRYHHLFADLLRQRLHQDVVTVGGAEYRVDELHIRASQWYEEHGLYLEAFQHATVANDVARAGRLIEGDTLPRHFRGAVIPILNWLGSLPKNVLDARPSLWRRYASLLLANGQTSGVEEKLQAAEAALHNGEIDEKKRNLIGQIASTRATLALTHYQIETMLAQAHLALEYLHPNNLSSRANANWVLGYAYLLSGDRTAARQAFDEAVSLSQAAGDVFVTILATIGMGNVQEVDNQLHLAAQAYQRVLQLASDQPLQVVYEAQLGLARIHYEWNDLVAAEQYGKQSLDLARQYESVIDRFITCIVLLARVKMAQGDVAGAAAILANASQDVRQHNFVHRIPEVTAAQVLVLLRQGNLEAAAKLAQIHELPMTQARVYLAQGNPSAALEILESFHRQVEGRELQDERLKVMVLMAIAHHANNEKEKAMQVLGNVLALAESGGFIRTFIDEGAAMAHLLSKAADHGILPDYVGKLLATVEADRKKSEYESSLLLAQPLVEPLSEREVEVLQLIARGLSDAEIGKRLFIAIDTVKGHNRKIYRKLQVHRRTEAVARARELGLV